MVFETILIALIGMSIGSFLNVVIYRLPLNISLINPKRSQCPKCQYTIKWYQNIPIFSYLFLKGKCNNCKDKISIIYPVTEILTTVVTILLFHKLGISIEFLFVAIICYILISLSFIDLKYRAVPDVLLVLLALTTLLYLFIYKIENLSTFFIFAGGIVILELFVTFYIQNIKSYLLKDESLKEQKSLGEGDIPIIAIIGGLLGLKFGIIAIFLSAILAIIPAIINRVLNKQKETPFIPYLSLAFFITYLNNNVLIEILERFNII